VLYCISMKYVLFIVAVFFAFPAQAAINPDLVICEKYGMEMIEKISDGGDEYLFCRDGDVVCEIEDVYSGFCNGEALPFLSCVEEGNHVFEEFEECCAGSVPYMKEGYVGQPSCKKINKVQEFVGDAIDNPAISTVLIVLGVGLITGFLVNRKKRKLNIE